MKPDFYALIAIILSSLCLDFWLLFVFKNLTITSLLNQLVYFALALILYAFGIAVYIKADLTKSPIDELMFVLSKRTGLNLKKSRFICEVTILLIGISIGGPFGIGTIIIAIFIGPLIHYSLSFLSKKNETK